MATGTVWLFDYPVSKHYKGVHGPLIQIDECELTIVWTLAKEGDLPIYQLYRKKEKTPKKVALWKQRVYELPEVNGIDALEGSRDRTGKRLKFGYSFIHRTVRKLERKHMIQTSEGTSRNSRIVDLTFLGLLLYLRGSTDKNKFEKAIEHHSNILFLPKETWYMLAKKLDGGKVESGLDLAVRDFVDLNKVRFRANPIGLEFEGFLKHDFGLRENVSGKVCIERNSDMAELLRSKEVSFLRDSYIAHLAVHDFPKLKDKKRKQIDKLLPHLDSESELAYFEGREVSSDPLFKGNRLKEFFPKYASAEYFLIGMFVENLLWQKRHVERKHEIYDFEVDSEVGQSSI
jgi:hypothetical protein